MPDLFLRPLHRELLERLDELDTDKPGAWWSFSLVAGRDLHARQHAARHLSELTARGLVERHHDTPAYRLTLKGREALEGVA